tara:strand:- start:444 stop:1481 length:1038 start_codon:yes stop_codon:yes gene_type:complete
MSKYWLKLTLCICLILTLPAHSKPVVNVYVWGGEIPRTLIHQFEKDTGIKVNFSTYDSNETMYTKLKASRQMVYDVIMPSGYFVERMRQQGMLEQLDKSKLPNLKNISKIFTQSAFDPGNQYSVPINWGITGIFYNDKWVQDAPTSWASLWENKWSGKLMLLDDARETFSIALMKLGYSPNDKDPVHIREAFEALLQLAPNIKMFASDSVQAIIIDNDAIAGIAWNGDVFKAKQENSKIQFVFPSEGAVIWVDGLAIPKNAPHMNEAYQFINYVLKPTSAKEIALREGYATTNKKGQMLLPEKIRDDKNIYPDETVLKRATIQRDVGPETLAIYNKYWQQLKLAI